HDNDVGPLDGLHVADGEGVVVETGDLLVHQQAHLHPLRPLGHRGGEEVDRVGGGHNVEGIFVLGGGGLSAGGEQQDKGAQGRNQFFHIVPLISKIESMTTLYYTAFFARCKTKYLLCVL